MKCAVGVCGHCQFGPCVRLQGRAGLPLRPHRAVLRHAGGVRWPPKPKLAVWKFASCDGCQLSLLDCEDELLAVVGRGRDRVLPRGLPRRREGTLRPHPRRGLDHHAARRRAHPAGAPAVAQFLVTIGACATAGGIQALRNFADVDEFTAVVYATPEYISTLATSTPISAARPGRLRAARLPDQQGPAPRGPQRLPARPPAQHPDLQRVHRVQAPRNRLRDGRARHALPRARHPGRLRRHLPVLPPRLLRLLRPDGVAEHRLASATGGRSSWAAAGPSSSAPSAPSTPGRPRSGPRATPMTTSARSKTDHRRRPRPRRGRRRPHRAGARRQGHGRQAPHLRAAPLLRGVPARPRLPRGAGHHRPHLRHLPRRLPDELGPRDGGRVRRERRRTRCARCAASSTAASGSRATRCTCTCSTPRTSSATRAPSHMAADHADVVTKALELKKIGNDLVTLVGGREIHPVNVRVGGFYRVPTRRELEPLAERLKRARELARSRPSRFVGIARLPRLRAGLRVRVPAPPRRVPLQRGADRLEQGARHRRSPSTRSTSSRSTSRTRTRCTRSTRATAPSTWARSRATASTSTGCLPSRSRRRGKRGSGPRAATLSRASWSAPSRSCSRCDEALRLIDAYEPPEQPAVRRRPRARARGTAAPRRRGACSTTATASTTAGHRAGGEDRAAHLAEPEDDRGRPLALRADRCSICRRRAAPGSASRPSATTTPASPARRTS